MEKPDFSAIRNVLSTQLNEHRFTHTLGVAYTSAALAMHYDVDLDKAMLAGILHDVSKRHKRDEYLALALKNNLEVTEFEKKEPELLHAKLSEYIAKNEFGVTDEEVLLAIRCHCTGKPDMTMLEKIVFIADYIEPSRNMISNLSEIRALAFENTDKAIAWIAKSTLDYLHSTNSVIDTKTEETYNFYKEF